MILNKIGFALLLTGALASPLGVVGQTNGDNTKLTDKRLPVEIVSEISTDPQESTKAIPLTDAELDSINTEDIDSTIVWAEAIATESSESIKTSLPLDDSSILLKKIIIQPK